MGRNARLFAVVPAAGRGERFGGQRPKQYVTLLGRPVLAWSLRALLAEPTIRTVVVALSAGDRRFARIDAARDPRVRTCVGGARRELSVANALDALAGEARDEDWVLVHDAARPCLHPTDVRNLVRTLRDDRIGGLLALPVGDTLKAGGSDGRSERTVPREGLWRALTPQMIRYGVLRRALALSIERERAVTDEVSAAPLIDPLHPELMLRPADGVLRLDHLTALAIGPGLGDTPDAAEYLDWALEAAVPLVVDADALNLIASTNSLKDKLKQRVALTILTPHPAEAARLLACTTAEVQRDRVAAALRLARETNAGVVLKGAGSICAWPDGHWAINTSGNPGMASAGMGDVLTGIITALLAQGVDERHALTAGVYLHAAAADQCVASGIGPIGLTASEVIDAARALLARGLFENVKQIDVAVINNLVDQFNDVSKLKMLSGLRQYMSDEDFDKVKDSLTVDNVNPNLININAAPKDVLLGLGIIPGDVERIVEDRTTSPYSDLSNVPGIGNLRVNGLALSSYLTTTEGTTFKVTAFATVGGYTRQVEAIVNNTSFSYWRSF